MKKISVHILLLFLLNLCITTDTSGQNTRGTLSVKNFGISDPSADVLELSRLKNDSNKVNQLLKITSIYFRSKSLKPNNLDSALYYANWAIALSGKFHDTEKHNEACFLACKILMDFPNLKMAKSVLSKTTGEERARLLLVIGEHYTFQPGETKENLDLAMPYIYEALQLSESISSLFWKAQSLMLLGKNNFERGNFEIGKKCFFKIINAYQKIGDKSLEANYWAELGRYMPKTDKTYLEGMQYFENAIALYEQIKDWHEVGSVYDDLGDMALFSQHFSDARKYYLKELAVQRSIGRKDLYKTYVSVAEASQLTGNLNEGLKFALWGLANMDALKSDDFRPVVYKILGDIYRQLEDPEKSTYYYQLGLSGIPSSLFNRSFHFITLKYFTDGLIKQNQAKSALAFIRNFLKKITPVDIGDREIVASIFGDCYNKLGWDNLAERYYLEMISLERTIQSTPKTRIFYSSEISGLEAYLYISRFYISRKRFALANSYLQTASTFKNVSPVLSKDLEMLRFKADSAAGSLHTAIKYYQRSVFLKDSLLALQRSDELARMRVQFETAQKEKNIKLLEQEKELQKKELEKSDQLKFFTFSGIIVLLLMLAVLFSRFRLKQKSNLLLQEQKDIVNKKNISLTQIVQEKEWLLKEVHHRVKNNLQIVMSLLKTQSSYLQDDAAVTAVIESRHRIQAMSLIHQKLYKSENASSIYMPEYIGELIDYLKDSFQTGLKILFKLDISPVFLDVVHAIPVGLILNEVITNSIKYAFPSQENAVVTVAFSFVSPGLVTLRVSDNGCGLADDFNIQQLDSFGLLLVQGLIGDLDGSFQIYSDNGTTIKTSFNVIPLTDQVI